MNDAQESTIGTIKQASNLGTRTIEEGDGRYQQGGFHPVHLGETYNDKYAVLRKLGYGRYSTVWLVRDIVDGKLWAMKVLSAECYGADTDVFELEILQRLRSADPTHTGYKFVSIIEDSFVHQGPNGKHVCLLFKVMGESLSTFRDWFDRRIPSPLVNRFTSQLLQALDYAHTVGVIHTDIKLDNIMVQVPDESPLASYLQTTQTPKLASASATDPSKYAIIPSQGLRDFYFPDAGFDFMTLDIVLSDWGVSSWTSDHLTNLIQPVLLRAPEVLVGAPWGPAVDVWNLGALVPELLYGQMMFSGVRDGVYSVKCHLDKIVDLLEPLPRSLLEKADADVVRDIFDDEGYIRDPVRGTWMSLERRFADMHGIEHEMFVAFIRKILKVDPENRKAAKELLGESWLAYDYANQDNITVEV